MCNSISNFLQKKARLGSLFVDFNAFISNPAQNRRFTSNLKPRDLGMVTENGNPIIAQGDYAISIGGGQPDTAAPNVSGHFHVDGQYALPE